jgi:hypothetical protein
LNQIRLQRTILELQGEQLVLEGRIGNLAAQTARAQGAAYEWSKRLEKYEDMTPPIEP